MQAIFSRGFAFILDFRITELTSSWIHRGLPQRSIETIVRSYKCARTKSAHRTVKNGFSAQNVDENAFPAKEVTINILERKTPHPT